MHAYRRTVSVVSLSVAAISGCQAYPMEDVAPKTVVAVETVRGYVAAQPPVLLVVQDRSGSMDTCFGNQPAGAGEACGIDGDTDGLPDTPQRSRMDVAQAVMRAAIGEHPDVLYGLTIYGAGGSACGTAQTVIPPAAGAAPRLQDAYATSPELERPKGGTPTTAALREAEAQLVNPDGSLRFGDRASYVVLITDGLMNCNAGHAMPCVCSQENGCGEVAFGGAGDLANPQLCLDDEEAIVAVAQLLAAGVKTFVIGLGESFGAAGMPLAVDTLNRLAEAGGIPRDDPDLRFHSAADEASLQASIDSIIESITAPCEYELDGPVCEGRLVSIDLRIDGVEVATSCDPALAGHSWTHAGSASRIRFGDEVCARLRGAGTVEVSIRGVENPCPDGTKPGCSLAGR